MFEVKVQFNTINDVKSFVNATCQAEFDIDLISNRYTVDAKSIMGIFSLDLSRPIALQAHTNDQTKADAFFASIAGMIVK